MLPQGDVRSDTILTVVEKDDPEIVSAYWRGENVWEFNLHAIGVHGLADEELVVFEVGNDLLGESLSTLLELLDLLLAGAPFGERLLDLLHVACRIQSVSRRGSCRPNCDILLRWPR